MVSPVTAAGSNPAAPRSSSSTNGPTLGQSDFIRLLTTQLKSQDPTDPVDNKEMIAQMAQFSSLSGIEQINSTLKDIAARLDQAFPAQTPVQE
ncbi:flagellar hook assembly protein FlgD [Novosphingobium ginsenosidimutans]|uniref:Basal-body rod modification protein FlgD n=1 Tax=Novosphingobium ginsenosidimutans TaxID=1176536 RepID=A0A5B8S2A4_9SPHN|nr:flagellar hook capping FlgD N-terminal domain-containing protein [Novosphingobium ginsenosidimutans]QEA15162.1 flagellar biosynthesis protein FlgD [Novosphingobium ginsenosidimutans]